MNILFIHGNYPAQFRSIASDLGGQGIHDVRFLTARKDPDSFPINGVKIIQYEEASTDSNQSISEAQKVITTHIKQAEIIQEKILNLINNGYKPDIIFFHGGNGLGLFLNNVAPEACTIGYFEWYFSKNCVNLILNRNDIQAYNFIKARNMCTESEILVSDASIVPTEWQASQFPDKVKNALTTIFDGVDTTFFCPPEPQLFEKTLIIKGEDNSLSIGPDDLLITYATRGMEPLRGFLDFMKALPELLHKFPNLKVLIGGRDRSAYGPACPSHNGSWKNMMIDKIPSLKDHPSIFYTGLMDYNNYKLSLQRTNLHCYLTYPYVTSWSLFEATACGAPIITNRSEATSGTISMEESNLLESITDIWKEEGLSKMTSILTSNSNTKRRSNLNEYYSSRNSMHQWAELINSTLQLKKKALKSI